MHRSGLTELEVVMAVVRRGSFRGAAQELGMSATAVSNAIAGLESRLETRLFNRTTRSVALTDAGQRYVARVGPALQEIRLAGEEIHSDTGEPAGTLRLNVPNHIGSLFLDQLLIDFVGTISDGLLGFECLDGSRRSTFWEADDRDDVDTRAGQFFMGIGDPDRADADRSEMILLCLSEDLVDVLLLGIRLEIRVIDEFCEFHFYPPINQFLLF